MIMCTELGEEIFHLPIARADVTQNQCDQIGQFIGIWATF